MKKRCCAITFFTIFTLSSLTFSNKAHANSMEDQFGAGARLKGMGNAGVAEAHDASATFHNPAGLASCTQSEVSVEFSHVGYRLQTQASSEQGSTAQGAFAELPKQDPLQPRTGYILGSCLRLPFGAGFGFRLNHVVNRAQYFNQTSLNNTPQFALLGQSIEALSIMAGGGIRPVPWFALGAAISVLANSALEISNAVPVVSAGSEVRNGYAWELQPKVAAYVGLQVFPAPWLRLGITYRSALYHRLSARAETQAEVAGVPFQIDFNLESVAWYSPQQISSGIAIDPTPWLTAAVDVTWYDWSAYPGPYIRATPADGSAVAAGLNFAPDENVNFVDTVMPRVGFEFHLPLSLQLRTGYAFRPTPAPIPTGRGNLLDGQAHVFSAGLGALWRNPLQIDETAFAAKSGAQARFQNWAVGIDLFTTWMWMPNRQVRKDAREDAQAEAFDFGGSAFDLGLAVRALF